MIRDVMPKDKMFLLEMAEKLYSSAAVAHTIDSRIHELNFDAAISKSPFIRAFIIEENDIPEGYAFISFSHATEVGGLVVLLEDLYISDTCRGKGLGSMFIQFVEQEYPSAKRFRLEVTKENIKAIELYCKLGYKTLDYVQMVKDL